MVCWTTNVLLFAASDFAVCCADLVWASLAVDLARLASLTTFLLSCVLLLVALALSACEADFLSVVALATWSLVWVLLSVDFVFALALLTAFWLFCADEVWFWLEVCSADDVSLDACV